MKKFCLAGAVAAVLADWNLRLMALQMFRAADLLPRKCRRDMRCRSVAALSVSPGASGYAPGHRDLDNRGTSA